MKPFIKVWEFHDAPQELQDLSRNGGDEDWLAVVPKAVLEKHYYIGWLEDGSPFGVCSVDTYDLPNGDRVYIGSHA